MPRSSTGSGSEARPPARGRRAPARERGLGSRLRAAFTALHRHYGAQHWWPAETPFEVIVGAVLTQNTAWTGAERAVRNLRAARVLDPDSLARLSPARLAGWLRPSGTFRVKARRLRNLCEWIRERGGIRSLSRWSTRALRRGLLGVSGVGRETADDILLYAFGRPVFVIDAYTRRLFSRLGWIPEGELYDSMRGRIEAALRPDPAIFNEYHALIVRHAKTVCRARPRCGECVLAPRCRFGRRSRRRGD